MAKTHYFAIDAAGREHTRSSDRRTYTHAVAYQCSKEEALVSAQSEQNRKQHEKNAQYYLDCIANGKHLSLMGFEHYRNDASRQAADVREAREKMQGFETAKAYAEKLIADEVASIEARDWSIWHIEGWCGRADLAGKLARSITAQKSVLKVDILEAQTR